MSNEELVIKIKAGIDVADNMALLYEQNKNYIYKVAKGYSAYAEMDDLLQEGYFGLSEAVERYDTGHGVKFITYAGYWFKQSMWNYIVNNGKTVRIPSFLQDRINKYNKFINTFTLQYNRKPSKSELSYYLDLSIETVENLEKHIIMAKIGSLDNAITGEEELTVGDVVASDTNIELDVVDSIFNKQLKEDLWNLVEDVLEEKEQKIVKNRYQDNKTLQSISDEMGITKSAVRQYQSKSLRKLWKGAKARGFMDKYEQEICHAWRGSLGSFNNTWTSSTEFTAMKLLEM
jgi:RNA polymerase primary sigma factor